MAADRDRASMRLSEALPYWRLGMLPIHHLPAIAYNEMLAGSHGDALAVLAGGHFDEAEANKLVERASEEAGIPPMDRKASVVFVARQLLDDIVAGAVAPQVGATALFDIPGQEDVPEVDGALFLALADEAERYTARRQGAEAAVRIGEGASEAEEDIVKLAQRVRERLTALDGGV